jgi:hypothetical protein
MAYRYESGEKIRRSIELGQLSNLDRTHSDPLHVHHSHFYTSVVKRSKKYSVPYNSYYTVHSAKMEGENKE